MDLSMAHPSTFFVVIHLESPLFTLKTKIGSRQDFSLFALVHNILLMAWKGCLVICVQFPWLTCPTPMNLSRQTLE